LLSLCVFHCAASLLSSRDSSEIAAKLLKCDVMTDLLTALEQV
jgi:hypothetical protein